MTSEIEIHTSQFARAPLIHTSGQETLTGLAYQSLLGGMGANRVVEVLARTGGFSVKVARHRLFETTQHILECTKSLESIQPGGAGFASSIRVRLLHAAVRQRIMKLEQSRPGYYNVDEYGVPINDLDCIGTIATFSASVIWISLPRQGLFLRKQEKEDYIALWRLIAHYTGTPTEPFESTEKAKMIMESLLMNEIDPSETSKVLAGNIIKCLEAQPPAYASKPFLEVNARWLNGNDLCDALGLGRPSLYYWALMAGQCLFFMAICYTYRSIRSLDQRKIAVSYSISSEPPRTFPRKTPS
jgi:ER-bound oxygenase mpaB/B'/Rubber oxygenase, catalytic domain